MKFTEFASLMDGEPAHIAFFSTFQFDPDFFERRLLRRCSSLSKARRIIVFMDAREWAALIRQDVHARWLNQRYLVVPVHRSQGVFHPKLSLLLSETGGQVLCGSNNLTRSGCSSNLELLNALPFDFEGNYEEEMRVASEAFRFFRRAAQDADDEIGRIATEWIDETEATFRWLDQSAEEAEDDRTVRLIHSYDGPLWNPLVEHLQSRPPDEFFIISPFHDKKCDIALRFAEQWPKAKINFIVQSEYTNLNVEPLTSLKRVQLHELQNSKSSRRAHAKLVAWRSSDGSGCLAGSANFTSAALNARNVETCLLIDSPDDLIDSLFDKQLSKKAIGFDEFEPGTAEEPDGEDQESPPLQLLSAVLESDTQVRVGFSHTLAEKPSSLRLAIRSASEIRTRIFVTLPNRPSGIETVPLRENALADAHGTILATMVADTLEGQLESDPLWIIQPHRLTYEPGEGSSSSKSIVEESGEGLPEYLDEIGKRDGIAGVVEYLRHLNIRFNDGGKGLGLRKFRIQLRDPFQLDTAPDWLIGSKNKSDDLAKSVLDFTKRHEKRKLRKHATNGNINGIENFLDIMRAMIRLSYVYYRREDVPITRKHVISVITRCIELATSGIENADDPWDGFLYSMWDSLDGDVETLRTVLKETGYTAEIRAILLVAQKERFASNEKYLSPKPPQRPREVLPVWANIIRIAFSECKIEDPSSDVVRNVLESYQMFSKDEIAAMVVEI
jgi:hypothetical protein